MVVQLLLLYSSCRLGNINEEIIFRTFTNFIMCLSIIYQPFIFTAIFHELFDLIKLIILISKLICLTIKSIKILKAVDMRYCSYYKNGFIFLTLMYS